MDIKTLQNQTDRSLANASFDPKKLALLHAGISLAVSLVITVLQFVLDRGIASTGGLSGIGTRTLLSTAQMMLSTASLLLTPFWTIGFFRASLNIARGENATPATLLEGFRRFLPVMRLFLTQMVLYFGLLLLCSHAASVLYTLTPFSNGMLEIMEPLMNDPELAVQALESGELINQLMPHMIGMYVILGILFAVLGIPLFYRFRMSQFVMMDDTATGALMAMRTSGLLMRGHRMELFRLDLHFWWFYAAQVLLAVIAWLDVLLPMLGIALPVNADVGFFLFYLVYILLNLLLTWLFTARIQTTYAHFYLSRKAPLQQENKLTVGNE